MSVAVDDDNAASSTDRENEAANRVNDGAALTAVSEASASGSEDELYLLSWISQQSTHHVLRRLKPGAFGDLRCNNCHGRRCIKGSVFCEGER